MSRTDELIFELEMETETPFVGESVSIFPSSSPSSSSPSTDTISSRFAHSDFSSDLSERPFDSLDEELPYFAQYHVNRSKSKQSITPPIPIVSTARSQSNVSWNHGSDTSVLNSLEKDSERFIPPHELVERSGFSVWRKDLKYRAQQQQFVR